MSIFDLATELIIQITDAIARESDLNNFVRSNRHFYQLLNGELYRRNLQNTPNYPSCLMWGIRTGNPGTVKIALEVGGVARYGPEAMKAVGCYDYTATTNLLLSYDDIDPNVVDEIGCTPLLTAIANRTFYTFETLLYCQKVDPNASEWRWVASPLELVMTMPNRHPIERWIVTKQLTECPRVDINRPFRRGMTAIIFAAAYLPEEYSQLILQRPDLDPWLKDERSGDTALHFAARRVDEDGSKVIKALLDSGRFSPNVRNKRKKTPLMVAASENRAISAAALLAADGIDLHAKDGKGNSALDIAAVTGSTDVLPLLMAAHKVGAFSDFPEATVAMFKAIVKAPHEAATALQLLSHAGVNPDADSQALLPRVPWVDHRQTPLSWAAAMGKANEVRHFLMDPRVDPDSRDCRGRTPLSWAACRGQHLTVRLLLSNEGIDPNSTDKSGRTPLFFAARKGHIAAVKVLLEDERVDHASADVKGRTPLSMAAMKGHKVIVQLLLRRGADPHLLDKKNTTPALLAKKQKHPWARQMSDPTFIGLS